MKSFLAMAFSVMFLSAGGAQDNDALVKKDKEQFMGTWKIVSFETPEGKKDDVEGATLSFTADKLEFKKGDETKNGTFSLNPLGKPKEIDLKVDDKEVPGIYKLEKDTLTLCVCLSPNTGRAAEFAAKGPYVLLTLMRAKE